MKNQPPLRIRLGLPAVFGIAAAHAVFFVLAFPSTSLWICAFLAPIALALACTLAGRTRDLLLSVFVTQVLAWGFLQWWVLDVTIPGFLGMIVYLALWSAIEAGFLRYLTRGSLRIPLVIALPVVLLGGDWLRGMVLLDGYPWYLRAQPLIDLAWFARLASIGGIWLPGLLALYLSAVVASFLRWWWETGTVRAAIATTCANMVIFIGAFWVVQVGGGTNASMQRQASEYEVLLIQTNLPTDNKIGWTYEQQLRDVPQFIRQTHEALQRAREQGSKVALIVWPETMLPSVGFETGDEFSDAIERAAEAFDLPMLVGSPCYLGISRNGAGEVTWEAHHNSAYLIDGNGPPYARVDKVFLTPFGETMPYISSWPWLEEQLLSFGAKGMSFDLDEGSEIVRLELPAPIEGTPPLRIAVPICFEDTMAPVVRKMVWEDGVRQADVLVNISNDGWFGGDDAGRAMHVLCARWRAIENRMWVLRAVNTGDSVAIEPDGSIAGTVPSGPQTPGWLLATVSAPDSSVPLYARIGDLLGGLCALLMGVLILWEWCYTWSRRSRRAGGTPERPSTRRC